MARQMGFNWLVIAFALQELLFYSVDRVLLFAQHGDEAAELLDFRLRGLYECLQEWMPQTKLTTDATHTM